MFGKKKTEKKTSSKKAEVNSRSSTSARKRSSETPSSKSITTKKIISKNEEFLYISNESHYEQVIERITTVKKTLWIGTADIKDLYVKDGRGTKPLLEVLSDLAKRGVAIRLIHAKEQGPAFRQNFDKSPALIDGMERILCPRVHFKIIVFDLKTAYVSSATLTGAGLGMKGENTRNFEAVILSTNRDFVKNAAEQFDSVWIRLSASANVNNFLSCKRA